MTVPEKLTDLSQDTVLADALHVLAQPLTALGFIVELGLMQSDPQALRQALVDAGVECRRAVAALESLRAAAAQAQQGGA